MASFIVCYDIQPRNSADFVRNGHSLIETCGADPQKRYETMIDNLHEVCAKHMHMRREEFNKFYYISLRSVCRWDLENSDADNNSSTS